MGAPRGLTPPRLLEPEVVAALAANDGHRARTSLALGVTPQGLGMWLDKHPHVAKAWPTGVDSSGRREVMRDVVAALHASPLPMRASDIADTIGRDGHNTRCSLVRLRSDGVVEMVRPRGPWRLTASARSDISSGKDPMSTDMDRTRPPAIVVWLAMRERGGSQAPTAHEAGVHLGYRGGDAGRRGASRLRALEKCGYVERAPSAGSETRWRLTAMGRERAATAINKETTP